MIIPIGDTPNPSGRPIVTWSLIAVNVAVYLWITVPMSSVRPEPSDPLLFDYIRLIAENSNISPRVLLTNTSAYDLFLFRYGFRSAEPGVVSLFSAMFLHSGFMHLFGNMLFLWIYGDNVEHRLGRIRFLAAYLIAGAAATIFFALFAGGSHLPMIGASGAISGVLGFYFLWFPKNRVKLFFFFFPFFMNTVLVPARFVLGFYLIIENLLPFFLTPAGGGGVAYGAHIGGFLTGILGAAVADRFPGGVRQAVRIRRRPSPQKTSHPEKKFHQAVVSKDLEQAVKQYSSLSSASSRRVLLKSDILDLGDGLLHKHQYTEAMQLFRRYISENPQGPRLDRAYLGCGLATFYGMKQPVSAYHYFLQALDVDPAPKIKTEALRHIKKIAEDQKH